MREAGRSIGRIRVLIVDESMVFRHLISQALSEDPEIEVVGAEAGGAAALARIVQLAPDVVTLDVDTREMEGLRMLRNVRRLGPHLHIVMFSTLTTDGASTTLEALAHGADDYVEKPDERGLLWASLSALRKELVPKIKQFFAPEAPAPGAAVSALGKAAEKSRVFKAEVVAIGVSTGGPQALDELIPHLPANLRVPVLIAQHMPEMFTRLLAERLRSSSAIQVLEAENGMEVRAGRVVLARGDHHLKIRRSGNCVRAELDQGPRVNFCRPSVDTLFRSVADVYGARVLSVMLTGMGSDGLQGTRVLKAVGSYSLVQDEQSSVVWGMPGSVAQAGLADKIVPLREMVPEILRLVAG